MDRTPRPSFRDGIDVALMIVLGIASYLWAVRSGFETGELREITTAQLRAGERAVSM